MYIIIEKKFYDMYQYEILYKLEPFDIGILLEQNRNVIIQRKSGTWEICDETRYQLVYEIGRLLSRQYIYG